MSITKTLRVVSVKLPEGDLRRIPTANRSGFIRDAVAEKLARIKVPEWQPQTAVGKRMLALRRGYIAGGGELLDAEGITAEIRARRGGLS